MASDATFDPTMSNFGAGTPSPDEVSRVLTALASSTFDHEGLLGNDLPILVLNFPTKMPPTHATNSSGGDGDPSCVSNEDCCWGEDIPTSGRSQPASSLGACCAMCKPPACSAYVFRAGECWLKSKYTAADGHNVTWSAPSK